MMHGSQGSCWTGANWERVDAIGFTTQESGARGVRAQPTPPVGEGLVHSYRRRFFFTYPVTLEILSSLADFPKHEYLMQFS